jgi:hypothetical protein
MECVCEDFGSLARSFSSMARFDEGAAQRLGQYTQAGQCSASRAADLQTIGYASMRHHNLWKQVGFRDSGSLNEAGAGNQVLPSRLLSFRRPIRHGVCLRGKAGKS